MSFLNEINWNRDHVQNIIERSSPNDLRYKRVLVNLVGRTANVLFGICDDSDAEYFDSKIRKLETGKSKLFQAMETQTHMVQSTITNVNSSLIELDKKQGSLKHKYIHLLSEVQAQQKETGILQFKTALAQKLTLLNVILSQYAYETDTLENIVNSAVQGFIHSSLLDASVLDNS